MPTCKNCAAELTDAFCATCGQRADTRRISWKWLGEEFLSSVFVLERGILFTLKELFTRPGYMMREYLDGKRKAHFKPLSFVLVMAAVYSILFRLMPPDFAMLDAPTKKIMEQMNVFMGQYYALVELGLVPLFAACTWLFLRKYGNNFAEHLVIQSFLSGQRIFFNAIAVPFNLLGLDVAMGVNGLLFLAYMVALLMTFIQLYRDRSVVNVMVRTLLALMVFFFSLGVGSILFGFLYKVLTNAG
ncbi:MAG: DUF3667 domain-containing protein [Flavobacteriales bacterium]|nr:DUF3667 domain-containing protein [Flavobacteriales bacterium]